MWGYPGVPRGHISSTKWPRPVDCEIHSGQHFFGETGNIKKMRASFLLAACACLAFGGCSSALGPDASVRVTNAINTRGSAVNLYWPCLINVPMPDVMKDTYTIEIDEQPVGEIKRCGYARVATTAGEHTIAIKSPLLLIDAAKMFGLKGPKYTVPANKAIYLRITYSQYVEYSQVSEDTGRSEIARMVSD